MLLVYILCFGSSAGKGRFQKPFYGIRPPPPFTDGFRKKVFGTLAKREHLIKEKKKNIG